VNGLIIRPDRQTSAKLSSPVVIGNDHSKCRRAEMKNRVRPVLAAIRAAPQVSASATASGGLVWAPAGSIIYVITAEQLSDPEYHRWAVERGSREFGEQLRRRGLID